MVFRAVAFDLDGTLLNSEKKINLENVQVIQELKSRGVEILLATGRHPQATHMIHHDLGLDSLAICCNGACLFDYESMKPILSSPLDKEDVNNLYHLCRKHDVAIKLYTDHVIAYEEEDLYISHMMKWRKTLPQKYCPTLEKIDDYQSFFATDPAVWKYTLFDQDLGRMKALAEEAENEFGLSCEWWSTEGLDITRADNTKGNCLTAWAGMKSIPLDEIVVFGDNGNDISMLAIAGLGVAMGQAAPYVQEHADIVAPGNNDSNAIACVLRNYF